jgi:hypothetical protein
MAYLFEAHEDGIFEFRACVVGAVTFFSDYPLEVRGTVD